MQTFTAALFLILSMFQTIIITFLSNEGAKDTEVVYLVMKTESAVIGEAETYILQTFWSLLSSPEGVMQYYILKKEEYIFN